MQKINYTESIKSTQQILSFLKKKQKLVDKINKSTINYMPTINQWVDNPNYFLTKNFSDIEDFAIKRTGEPKNNFFKSFDICRAAIGYYTVEINEEYFFVSSDDSNKENHRVRVIDQKLKDTKWLIERVVSDAYTICNNKPKVFFEIKGYFEDQVLTCCTNFEPKLQNMIYDEKLLSENYLFITNSSKKSKK